MKDNSIKKGLVVFVILLFIGVAVSPSINFKVVKASNDNDLVEVTSQACGIQEFGNTTVKLTRQQYQNLEQYLVDFRARLNKTTTREEAVPIFKEAVVELNKYSLLPKGMSIEQAQCFVTVPFKESRLMIYQRLHHSLFQSILTNYNFLCLIAGVTRITTFLGAIPTVLLTIFDLCTPFGILKSTDFADLLYGFFEAGTYFNYINPIKVVSTIYLGTKVDHSLNPATGYFWSLGVLGMKEWDGSFIGVLRHPYLRDFPFILTIEYCPAVNVFTGIRIISGTEDYYFGSALLVGILRV